MDKARYCAEAFSPITGGCFQVVSRQDGQAGWSPVTLSSENALSGSGPIRGRTVALRAAADR
jgi:hypothetical protein